MKITLRDIAERVGCSQVTVSRVMNGRGAGQASHELIDRIKQAACDLRYRPSSTGQKITSLLGRSDRRITVLISTLNSEALKTSGWRNFLSGLTFAASFHNLRLEITPVSHSYENTLIDWENLADLHNGSAVVAFSPWMMNVLQELNRRGCRIAYVHDESFWAAIYHEAMSKWMRFVYRNRQGCELIMKRLLASGCRRPAITYHKAYMHEPDYIPRSVYCRMLSQSDINYRNGIVLADADDDCELIRQAFAENPFDALITHAFPFDPVRDIHKSLGIPANIPVVFRGSSNCVYQPHCSCIDFDFYQIGVDVAEALTKDPFIPGEYQYEPILVENE